MKWKLASAFAAGAALAAGIVYFSVKPDVPPSVPPSVSKIAAIPPPIAPAAPVPVASTPAPEPPAPQAPPPIREKLSPKPVREKPSPMPPPVRRADPIRIARNDLPASAAPRIDPPPLVPAPQPLAPAPRQVPVENVSLPAPIPTPTRVPNTVTMTAGMILPVRIGETLSSARNQPGDSFVATLTQPLVVDGWVIAERGARVEGRIVDAGQAGRVKGASRLSISIVRITLSDGQTIRVRTEPFAKDAASSAGTDTAKIGGGAALGAIIGAITGGGKGAAIGAGAGGAIGAGDVLLTRGKPAEIPVETRVNFKVQDPVSITERIE